MERPLGLSMCYAIEDAEIRFTAWKVWIPPSRIREAREVPVVRMPMMIDQPEETEVGPGGSASHVSTCIREG